MPSTNDLMLLRSASRSPHYLIAAPVRAAADFFARFRGCAGVNVEVQPVATVPWFALAGASGSAKPAVRHDQFNLLVLGRVAPHFAAVRVDAPVTVDAVKRGGADAHHHQ